MIYVIIYKSKLCNNWHQTAKRTCSFYPSSGKRCHSKLASAIFYFSYSIYECKRVDIFKWVTELLRSLAAFPRGRHAGMQRSGQGWEAGARGCARLRLGLCCLCSVISLSILHLTPVTVWKISSLEQVYYGYMLATMCIITVSITWPHFC